MTESELNDMLKHSPDEGHRAVFDQYYNYVYAVTLRILRGTVSMSDIEECVIDTFADVMLNYDPENGGSLKAYIGTVAKRNSINLMRKSNRKSFNTVSIDSDDFGEIVSGTNVEHTAENRNVSEALINAVKALGEPDSIIIIQKYFYDRKSSEIGKIVGLSPIAVRARTSRAMKKLKNILADFC
ncbi:MAG: sigma-70 family RNA polymerase sigma factor [Oscillospiraceae bacterium]|nr:sigma-70 family RNA polymerase sigma factor [Oscillospiraceae bacterium]MBR6837537.1 sigma-70 family RNA polymerase sigma factor [Oscillospiraceae bacterium]